MADLVGTCPKDFWEEWIAEGDAAGDPETGEEWGWYTSHRLAAGIKPGDRFYVVAHGKLRGYAIVTRLGSPTEGWIICRKGNAVACTIDEPIPGFRGLRLRWWKREQEKPFPDWKRAVDVRPSRSSPPPSASPLPTANPSSRRFPSAQQLTLFGERSAGD